MSDKLKILVVCLGNICRSPAAEVILREKSQQHQIEVDVDSCGLGDWHIGQRAHHKMIDAAGRRGIRLEGRAKQFQNRYFEEFDLILAADQSVLEELQEIAPTPEMREKLYLYTHFSKMRRGEDIPDPYFGGDEGFDQVLDLLEEVLEELIQELKLQKK